jgi:hypothetical protein
LREKHCWLVADGWFVLREKYGWLVHVAHSTQAATGRWFQASKFQSVSLLRGRVTIYSSSSVFLR